MNSPTCSAPAEDTAGAITTSADLHAAGMSKSAIARRCRPGGPWRRLLPGVILLGKGEPTRHQLLQAAVRRLAGTGAVISGADALHAYGIPVRIPPAVHLLVPPDTRAHSPDVVRHERTARLPKPVVMDGLPFAPAARAALDTARRATDLAELREMLELSISYGLCTCAQLRAELDAGSQRGTGAVRVALRDIAAGEDPYLRGLATRLLDEAPLPAPVWGGVVADLRGRPIGEVDAWWDEVALGWRFGKQDTGHLGHLGLTAAGVVLVRTPPDQLRAGGDAVLRELAGAFRTAVRRRRPRVRHLPPHSSAAAGCA